MKNSTGQPFEFMCDILDVDKLKFSSALHHYRKWYSQNLLEHGEQRIIGARFARNNEPRRGL